MSKINRKETTQVSVILSTEIKLVLDVYCEEEYITLSQLCRKIIEQYAIANILPKKQNLENLIVEPTLEERYYQAKQICEQKKMQEQIDESQDQGQTKDAFATLCEYQELIEEGKQAPLVKIEIPNCPLYTDEDIKECNNLKQESIEVIKKPSINKEPLKVFSFSDEDIKEINELIEKEGAKKDKQGRFFLSEDIIERIKGIILKGNSSITCTSDLDAKTAHFYVSVLTEMKVFQKSIALVMKKQQPFVSKSLKAKPE